MRIQDWFQVRLGDFREDFDYRLGSIILDLTERISERMRAKGISRSALADKLGVTPAAVTKILRGNSNFTLKTLLSLADALDYSLTVGFEEKAPRTGIGTYYYIPKKTRIISSEASTIEEKTFQLESTDTTLPDGSTFIGAEAA